MDWRGVLDEAGLLDKLAPKAVEFPRTWQRDGYTPVAGGTPERSNVRQSSLLPQCGSKPSHTKKKLMMHVAPIPTVQPIHARWVAVPAFHPSHPPTDIDRAISNSDATP